jgi:hypothetical protein
LVNERSIGEVAERNTQFNLNYHLFTVILMAFVLFSDSLYLKMGAHVSRTDFEWTTSDEPHAARRKEILGKYFLFGI